jgi:RNA polymerase sigma-70 factor (ECF subfamily)
MSARLQTLLDRRSAFLGFIQRRVSDRELAEDILQAAYLRALEHSDKLRDSDSIVAWFYALLRNAIVDLYRRHASESSALERLAVELGSDEPSTPDPSMHAFVCGCIEQVLPALRPAYADILREVDLNEEPLSEFAHRHQLTAGNAAVRAHRARLALRRELTRFCGSCSTHGCLDCKCKRPASPGTA